MSDGRAKNGGARAGSGRKSKEQLLELHSLLSDAWPAEKRREAIENMAEIALGESKAAVSAFLALAAYAYGKPVERKEISGPDGEPLKAYVTVSPDEWDATSDPTD